MSNMVHIAKKQKQKANLKLQYNPECNTKET